MSTLSKEALATVSAFAEDVQSCLDGGVDELSLAGRASDIAVSLEADAPQLAGALNLCRAALIAVSNETSPKRLRALLEVVDATVAAVMKAAEDDSPAAADSLKRATAGLMQAIVRYQTQAANGEEPEPQAAPVAAAPTPAASTVVHFQLLPAELDAELLAEFITECRDYLSQSESALLALETNPDDAEAVNTVFRAFHTIKGTSGFVGTQAITEVAHRAETLLSRVRDREVRYGGVYADLALQATDVIGELLTALEEGITTGTANRPEGFDALLANLDHPESMPAGGDGLPMRVGDIVVAANLAERSEVEQAIAEHPDEFAGEAMVSAGVVTAAEAGQALRTQQRASGESSVSDATLRVRTDRLDKLIDTVGELVIAHSMVAQDELVSASSFPAFSKKVAQAGKLVRELQDLSMTMRMVPLKATFQKMERLVRDLARKSGKQVTLVTEGEETEIDRTMVDGITDPLVHMIRNAVDHGIGAPDARKQAGKPPTGTIRLKAAHIGGHVVVSIQDDGRGLDRERIVEKALSKGVIPTAEGLTERQAFDLIFAPGFSTAETVTDVSGRGVGMDVVKRNITGIGGHIEIASAAGQGSTFSMHIPLTLAITDGMLVHVGEQRYIIPTRSISLTFRPEASALTLVADQGELVRFRDHMLPLVRLHRLFEIPGAVEKAEEGLLVVVEDSVQNYALLVDGLLGQQQVVTKPLGAGIGQALGLAGAAILGDGRVGLILDSAGIAALSRDTDFDVLAAAA